MTPHTETGMPSAWRLRNADRGLRVFITSFLLVITAGYAIGLAFVDHTTGRSHKGLVEEYRGSSDSTAAEMRYAKSPDEMYIFLHNHVLSLGLVFFAVGAIFYWSSILPLRWKEVLIIEPFIAIGTTFGGLWLMRFVAEQFSWLVILSGTLMVASYLLMVCLILVELWKGDR